MSQATTSKLNMGVANVFWNLPNKWKWILISDIAPRDSKTVQPAEKLDEVISYLGLEDVAQGQWNDVKYQQILGQEIKSSCIKFDKSHVLYAKLRPYLNKVVVPNQSGFGSTEWVSFQPISNKLLRDYLAWFLRCPAFVSYASTNVTGARMPRVRMDVLLNAPIPIPFPDEPTRSLDIQRRIVARIETLLAEVKDYRSLINKMRQDAERLIYIALEEVFKEIISSYPLESLKNHIVYITSGSRGWSKYANQTNHGSLFIRVGNVGFSRIDLSEIERLNLPPNTTEAVRAKVVSGDVLVTITGTIGRCCVVPDNLGEAYVNQHVALIRLKESLEPSYLMWFILSPSGGAIQTTAMQYGQTKPGLSLTNVRNLSLPIPNKALQRQIVAYLDKIQNEVDEILKLLEQDANVLDMLEKSILERAFRGEL